MRKTLEVCLKRGAQGKKSVIISNGLLVQLRQDL